ncbi:hypothetical protein Trydic_g5276 [Trypoxylus dichotomus]
MEEYRRVAPLVPIVIVVHRSSDLPAQIINLRVRFPMFVISSVASQHGTCIIAIDDTLKMASPMRTGRNEHPTYHHPPGFAYVMIR